MTQLMKLLMHHLAVLGEFQSTFGIPEPAGPREVTLTLLQFPSPAPMEGLYAEIVQGTVPQCPLSHQW